MLQFVSCPVSLRLLPSCTALVSFSIRWVCVGGGGREGWLYCCGSCLLRLSRNLIPRCLVARAEGRLPIQGKSGKILNTTMRWQRVCPYNERNGKGRAGCSDISVSTLWLIMLHCVVLLPWNYRFRFILMIHWLVSGRTAPRLLRQWAQLVWHRTIELWLPARHLPMRW